MAMAGARQPMTRYPIGIETVFRQAAGGGGVLQPAEFGVDEAAAMRRRK